MTVVANEVTVVTHHHSSVNDLSLCNPRYVNLSWRSSQNNVTVVTNERDGRHERAWRPTRTNVTVVRDLLIFFSRIREWENYCQPWIRELFYYQPELENYPNRMQERELGDSASAHSLDLKISKCCPGRPYLGNRVHTRAKRVDAPGRCAERDVPGRHYLSPH